MTTLQHTRFAGPFGLSQVNSGEQHLPSFRTMVCGWVSSLIQVEI